MGLGGGNNGGKGVVGDGNQGDIETRKRGWGVDFHKDGGGGESYC